MKKYALALIFAIPLSFSPAAHAQRETFTVNPNASKIAFALGGNVHHVDGTFHVQSGSIVFGPSSGAISGSVIVAAGSGNSGNTSRDHNMDKNVLQTSRFPQVTFAPKSYQGKFSPTGASTIKVSGIFTLHGTPHNITVPVQIHIDGSNTIAKGHFMVPYVQWGLKNPSILFLRVAKVVGINLTLVGHISPSK